MVEKACLVGLWLVGEELFLGTNSTIPHPFLLPFLTSLFPSRLCVRHTRCETSTGPDTCLSALSSFFLLLFLFYALWQFLIQNIVTTQVADCITASLQGNNGVTLQLTTIGAEPQRDVE